MVKRSEKIGIDVLVFTVIAAIVGLVIVLITSLMGSKVMLQIGDGVFNAQIASNSMSREKGLGDTKQLKSDQALILAYPSDDKWSIWMKDMSVPIDIIWLDVDHKIVHIVKNVSPDSQTFETFTPKKDARFVIELPAGSVDKFKIKVGPSAVFDIGDREVR